MFMKPSHALGSGKKFCECFDFICCENFRIREKYNGSHVKEFISSKNLNLSIYGDI